MLMCLFFFFSSRRRHTRLQGDWSSDVCSSDLSSARTMAADGQGSLSPALRGSPRNRPRGATRNDRPAGRASRSAGTAPRQIGRASCRGRGENLGGGGSFKKKKKKKRCIEDKNK